MAVIVVNYLDTKIGGDFCKSLQTSDWLAKITNVQKFSADISMVGIGMES